jgi:hypothetical protein
MTQRYTMNASGQLEPAGDGEWVMFDDHIMIVSAAEEREWNLSEQLRVARLFIARECDEAKP